MPIYLYQNKETLEIREIYQSINDKHVYFDENQIEWNRVYTVPFAAIDSKIDAFSSNDFVKKTDNKKQTYGDLWERSGELSEKRKDICGGRDPVKEKYFEDYKKKNKIKHLADK